jgi:two-component system, sensor histidine kinase
MNMRPDISAPVRTFLLLDKWLRPGLAIVKRLPSLLDHPVQVRSVLGRGSVFPVDVPLIGVNRSTNIGFLKAGETSASRDGKGVIVLIDDEVFILRGLKVILESWEYAVIAATSEAEAMKQLEERPDAPT